MESGLSENIIASLSSLYDLTGIPFVVLERSGEVAVSFPEHLEVYYNTDFWVKNQTRTPRKKGHHPNGASIFEIGDYCYVALTKLGGELIFCTVPVRTSPQIENSFFPALQKGFAEDRLVEFYRFLLDVPVMTTYQLAELCSVARHIYCGEPTDGVNLRHLLAEKKGTKKTEREMIAFTEAKEGTDRHRSIKSERAVTEAITAGDEAALKKVFSRPQHGEIGKMSLNTVRQAKYEFICMMFAASRAAIEGGISAENSFDLCDHFCQRMDAMNDAKAVRVYMLQCLETYCKRVAEGRHDLIYSSYTREAQEFIEKHLYEPLDVETVSSAVGLNKRSLGEYMKRDTGLSIASYILDKRLCEAAYLLQSSDMELSAISELLQFSSQSHFSTRFKEKYSIAPLQYRLRGI